MPLTVVESFVGPYLVAEWISTLLFGIQLSLGYRYFKHYKDETYMRVIVGVVFALDIAAMVAEYTDIFLMIITNYGNPAYLGATVPGTIGVYLSAIPIIGAIVQSFLVSRIWRLSKNIYISITLMLGVVLSLGAALALMFLNVLFEAQASRPRQKLPATIWLVTGAIVDVLIAIVLVYYLGRAKQRSSFKHTQSILTRLMASSLETGSVTAVLAILVEIFFQVFTQANYMLGVLLILGRTYSITLTYNLLRRRDLRKGPEYQSTNSGNYGTNNSIGLGGVARVHPTQSKTESTAYPIEIQVTHSHASQMDPNPSKSEDKSADSKARREFMDM